MPSIFVLLLTSLLLLLTTVAIYRAYIHPLSSFPGPTLFSVSRLPLLYNLALGRLPFRIHQLHEKYGPVVRLAPNELSFINNQAWNDIYSKQPGKPQLGKDPTAFPRPESGVNGILFETDDAIHGRMRRNFSQAFAEKNIRDQEPILQKYIDMLISCLRQNTSRPQDLCKWLNFVTFDITGDLVFGESFDCLNTSTLHLWVKMLFNWVAGSSLLGQAQKFRPWPLYYIISYLIPKHLKDADVNHQIMTQARMDKRLANEEPHADLMSHVAKFLGTENGLSYTECLETLRIIVVGGSETTATLLSGLFYYILTTPSVYAVLSKETRSSFKNSSEITMASVQKLEYQLKCINEALRILPPLPGSLRRITPKQGWNIAGRWVPGETLVAIDMYAAYHSSSHFVRPEEFIPERWNENPPEEFRHDELKVVQPFSTGPRNCIGKSLAYMEMRLILAKLLYNFDFQIMQRSEGWLGNVKAYGFFKKPELWVIITEVVSDDNSRYATGSDLV